jgi:hypothetical protein
VSFNDYNNNPDGNLNYTLTNEDIDLSTLSPSEIRTIAKEKILEELAKETEEEVE